MERLTRPQAKALGKPRCFGSVCTKHPQLDGERYVSGACVGCAKDFLNASRSANKERTKEHNKKQYLRIKNNPSLLAKKKIKQAEYRKTHPDKINASIKKWRAKNKHLLSVYVKRCKAKNPDNVLANTARRRAARLRRTPAWLTADDLWMMQQAYELAKLRTKMFGFRWHVDHIIPLQGAIVSGLHTPNNLQVIPWYENIAKGNAYEVV